MKKTKIITALYTDDTTKNPPFFGHQVKAREERYFHSLRTLNNLDTEIICYCNETQFEEITNYVNEFKLLNVTVKISNLIDSKYTKRMIEIKNNDGRFNFYHEIDWNKIFLMGKELNTDYEYIYWIDVGLSHHGLFPNRFHPDSKLITGMSKDYGTYQYTKVFKREFIDGLNLFLGDKLLTINNDVFFHSVTDLNHIMDDNINYNGLSVGGILGGHISKIEWFINNFNLIAEKSLNKNYILNHESLISYLKEKNPENFKSFNFQTWYHEDSVGIPNYIKGMISFSSFFDFIFDEFVNFRKNSIS